MEIKDVPQWVTQSFVRSILNVGATTSRAEIIACCTELIQAWRAPGRFAHDFQHLLDMLSRVDSLASETPNADLVRIATWFHGIVFSTADLAVYTRNGGEDEFASAQIAKTKMRELGLPDSAIKAVAKLIIGLKKRGHDLPEAIPAVPANLAAELAPSETGLFAAIDMNQHALNDAHLGSLAVEPQRYAKYAARIREEYAHIPLTHFLAARIRIVQRLLQRKKLFMSPLAAAWESVARQNLTAELERLTAELEAARDTHQARDTHPAAMPPDTVLPETALTAEDAAALTFNTTSLAVSAKNSPAAAKNSLTRAEVLTASDQEAVEHLALPDSFHSTSPDSSVDLPATAATDFLTQPPCSSLELIDEDFSPERRKKASHAAPPPVNLDSAQQTPAPNVPLRGIEAEPDF